MTRTERRQAQARRAALDRLAQTSTPWLPMPLGDDRAGLTWDEWYEYQERRKRHLLQIPQYDDDGRPSLTMATAVWKLLDAALTSNFPLKAFYPRRVPTCAAL